MVNKRMYDTLRLMIANELVSDPKVTVGMVERLMVEADLGKSLGVVALYGAMNANKGLNVAVLSLLGRWNELCLEGKGGDCIVLAFNDLVDEIKRNRIYQIIEMDADAYNYYYKIILCMNEVQLPRPTGRRIFEEYIDLINQLYLSYGNSTANIDDVEALFLEVKRSSLHRTIIIPLLERWETLFMDLNDIDSVDTVEDIKDLYDRCKGMTYKKHRSKIKSKIADKWSQLCIDRIDDIQTVTQAKVAYGMAPKDRIASELILQKWADICIRDVDSIKTISQAKVAYEMAPNVDEAKRCVLGKWDQLFEDNVSHITTLEQADYAMQNSPVNMVRYYKTYMEVSNARDRLFLEKINSIEDASRLFNSTIFWSHDKRLIFEKWNHLCVNQIDSIESIEQANEAYCKAPPDSEARDLILKKLRKLQANLVRETDDIYLLKASLEIAADDSIRTEIVDKLEKICIDNVESINSIAEAKAAYEIALADGVARRMISEKWNQLCTHEVPRISTIKEAEFAFANAPKNSESRQLIRQKYRQIKFDNIEKIDNVFDARDAYLAEVDWDYREKIRDKFYKLLPNINDIDDVDKLRRMSEACDAFGNRDLAKKCMFRASHLYLESISLDQIKTVEQAKLAYENAPSMGVARKSILARWNCIFSDSVRIDDITTVKKAEEVYELAPYRSRFRKQINKLLTDLYLAEISLDDINDLDQIKTAYDNAPEVGESRKIIDIKWHKMYIESLKGVKSIEDLDVIREFVPHGRRSKELTRRKSEELSDGII